MQQELAKTSIHAKEGRIEIAYLSENALHTFKTQSSQIAIMSPGEPFHIKEAGKDWLMNWYLVQEKALTLFGPPPKTLIAPTTREEFLQAVRDHANAWRNWLDGVHGRPGQAYAILTLCRAYYTSQNGEQTSKKRAAQWTAKAFPQWSTLIENALKWREDWRNNQVDAEETLPETKHFVQFILDQIPN
jgi:hypothetical protein